MEHFYEEITGYFNFPNLYSYAVDGAVDGAVFVELGTWYGKSASYMLSLIHI